ncbi:SDR family oxidoreductase [Mycobacterium sp. MYCO198283]|uniref:SDR family NAD(P)-dependent oxidoreductase n=1 Tax=Mycobacterium sp. MYCO198283 TaxID=2883505 RepID=UPI001E373524|nr:SDR family oxidoreductase [Mycobacterium sp. MYCO198283]MCG5433337.1 SDR family oxidoreductase [Mycobacterium sp. MYCO198283]
MTDPRRAALITGASAGIGAAFARHLAAQGYDVLLVARRADRLEQLAAELQQAHGGRAEVLAADLTDPTTPAAIVDHAAHVDMPVDVLINNAGLSASKKFSQNPWESVAGEIQLMVTATTELAHRVIPDMKQRGWGRIVNLSSLAAMGPPGEGLLYTGIKAYVLHMSQSLDMELKPHGVHVTALCPGFTHSEFHDVMDARDAADRLPGLLWQNPEDVVREGYEAVMAGKPICIPGTVNKLTAAAVRPLPQRLQYILGRNLNPFK